MEQIKRNINHTSLKDRKESSPFSSGSSTPNNNSKLITWLASQSKSSKFTSFWYKRFNIWSYDTFVFLCCVMWKDYLFIWCFSKCASPSSIKMKISSSPQKCKFLLLYLIRLNLFKYMGLPILESSYNI